MMDNHMGASQGNEHGTEHSSAHKAGHSNEHKAELSSAHKVGHSNEHKVGLSNGNGCGNESKHSTWKDSNRRGVLTIQGIQRVDGQEDHSEVISPASYVKKDGKRYLFYKEYMEGGASQKVRLTIEEKDVYLKKTGFGVSNLHFHKGHMEPCFYQSPVGPMELVSKTRAIRLREGEHHLTLKLEYALYMHAQHMSDYELEISWKENPEEL